MGVLGREVASRSQEDAREIATTELFAGKKEVVIVHKETRYRLIITKADKLILNK